MALNENKKLQTLRSDLRIKRTYPADAGTYHVGELLMVGPASNTVKPISSSAEPGVQVVGIITKEQTVTQGEHVECEAGYFVLSGSGFTSNETNKLAFASDSSAVYDLPTGNRQYIGRFKGFTIVGSGTNNAVFEIGQVVSGTTA